MTDARAKSLKRARRALQKATNKFYMTGDVEMTTEIILMQTALTDAYKDSSMKYYRM